MYKLSRITIANIGHKDAVFGNNTIDFTKPDGSIADSVMLNAPNGNGKTTILSFMLHIFMPAKKDFVQTRQKNQHKFYQYIAEKRPGFFAMEMCTREQGLYGGNYRPSKIIGVIVTRSGDVTDETFFLVEPGNEFRFEDLPTVSALHGGKQFVWGLAEKTTWLKAMQQASNERKIKFRAVYNNHGDWQKLLKDHNFPIESFRSQVDMASSEGGIEKFLEVKTSDEMLEKIFGMILDKERSVDTIADINRYLDQTRNLPEEERIAADIEKFIEVEKQFSHDFDLHAVAERQSAASWKQVRGAARFVESYVNENKTRQSSLKSDYDTLVAERLAISQTLQRLKIETEALRMAEALAKLSDAEARLKEIDTEILRMDAEKAIFDLVEPYRNYAQDRDNRDILNSKVRDLRAGIHELVLPLQKSGSAFKSRLVIESRAIRDEIKRQEANKAEISSEWKSIGKLKSGVTTKSTEVSMQIGAIKSYGEEIDARIAQASAIDSTICSIETLATALTANQETLARWKTSLLDATVIRDGAVSSLHEAQALYDTAFKDRDTAMDAKSKAEARLLSYVSDSTEISENILAPVFLENGRDPSDEAVSSLLEARETDFRGLIEGKRVEIGSIRGKIAIAEGGGAFEDENVQRAIAYCERLGISDVAPFTTWISNNVQDVETARDIVEERLDVALGLRVFALSDLEILKNGFDRNAGALTAPVTVTLAGLPESRPAGPDSFVMSAQTDYAYHEPTRQLHLAALLERLDELSKEMEVLQVNLDNTRDALKAVRDFRVRHGGKGVSHLENLFDSAQAELTRCEDSLTRALIRKDAEEASLDLAKKTFDQAGLSVVAFDNSTTVLKSHADFVSFRIDDLDKLPPVEELKAMVHQLSDELAEVSRQEDENRRKFGACTSTIETHQNNLKVIEAEILTISHTSDEPVEAEADIQTQIYRTAYRDNLDAYNRNDSLDSELRILENNLRNAEEAVAKSSTLLPRREDGSIDPDKESRLATLSVSSSLISDREELLLRLSSGHAEKTSLLTRKGGLQQETLCKLDDNHPAVNAILKDIIWNEDAKQRKTTVATEIRSAVTSSTALEGKVSEASRKLREMTDNVTTADSVKSFLEGSIVNTGSETEPVELTGSPDTWRGQVQGSMETAKRQQDHTTRSADKAKKSHDTARSAAKELKIGHDGSIAVRFSNLVEFTTHGLLVSQMIGDLEHMLAGQRETINNLRNSEGTIIRNIAELLDESRRLIVRALKKTIPKSSGNTFSGMEIIKLGAGISISDISGIDANEIARTYLAKMRAEGHSEAGISLTKMLTAMFNDIATRLNRHSFELRLLKPVVQAQQQTYEPIHKLSGSGGQTITAGLLLNILATSLPNIDSDSSSGFLILDNPIGKANNKTLVDTQLNVAKAFGIQIISASGINDRCLVSYDWIVTFIANRQSARSNGITVSYEENNVENFHIGLLLPEAEAA